MKLSVVILSFNSAELTLRCLDSLSPTMERNGDYKVVVIDNGSSSGSLLSMIEDRDYGWKKRLIFVALPENLGVAGGRNVGIRISGDSEFIMFLDNDTVVPPAALESLVEFMSSHPDVGLAAPRLISPQGKVQLSFKNFPGIGEKVRNVLGRKNELDVSEACTGEVMEPFYVIGACQIFRSSIVKEIGMLDDNIFFGPEDADFCMRIREAGKRVVYIPTIEIVHDWQRSSRRSLFSPMSRAHARGLFYFYKKWHRFF